VRPVNAALASVLGGSVPPARQSLDVVLSAEQRTRTCHAGNKHFSGPVFHCAPVFCPAVNLSALILGACLDCAGLDAILSLPRTSHMAASGTTHVSAMVVVDCPKSHTGKLMFTCSAKGAWRLGGKDGWANTSTPQLHGYYCRRKHCPRMQVDILDSAWSWMNNLLPGYRSANVSRYRAWLSPRWVAVQLQEAVAVFDEVPEGTIVSVDCASAATSYRGILEGIVSVGKPPTPSYEVIGMRLNGSLSQECPRNHNSWVQLQGQCLPRMCPAGVQQIKHLLASNNKWNGVSLQEAQVTLPMRFPRDFSDVRLARFYPSFRELPCCSDVTKAGGCANTTRFGFGMFRATCQEQHWRAANNIENQEGAQGFCVPHTAVQFRLDSMDGGASFMVSNNSKRWYNVLRDTFKNLVDTNGTQALLPHGFLSTVSVSVAASEWRPVYAKMTQLLSGGVDRSYTIDATPPQNRYLDPNSEARYSKAADEEKAHGRGAAAFATVACRQHSDSQSTGQHGFGHAAFVSSCGALASLVAEITDDGRCKSMPDLCRLDQLPHPVNRTQLLALLHDLCGPVDAQDNDCPTWLTVSPDADFPSRWMSPSLGDAGTEGASWSWETHAPTDSGVFADTPEFADGRDGVVPVMREVDHPHQPFSSCVGDEESLAQCFHRQLMDGTRRRAKTQPQPCRQKLIVACAAPTTGDLGLDSGFGQPATWVVGDRSVPTQGWSDYQSNQKWEGPRTGALAALTQPKLFYHTLPRRCELPERMAPQWQQVDAAKVNCTWGEAADVRW
jgi:hypothetical protein